MSILVNKNTRLLVQNITGKEGIFHTKQMVDYGTNVVSGVTPGKGGEWVLDGKIPVFDSVKVAVEATGANTSVVFVPARFAADALFEAADAGIPLIICITEGIPVQDMMRVRNYLDQKGVRLVGPNCPGILTPGEAKVGIIPGDISIPGNVGIVSRSGTLTYEVLYALMMANMGVSTCLGIGGDPINGTNFLDALEMFEADPHTDMVVLIGEIGGTDEEKAAEFIADRMTKSVVGFIAGRTAPPGKRMGHAGAIVEGGSGLAVDKIKALQTAGVKVANHPEEIPLLFKS
ncbi:MAG: succinate--CoA ligase subunit alpha [Anaerolineales bacterium]|nr:succinate--CoA ligase subunit alpha [Anaerolineales bacterium]